MLRYTLEGGQQTDTIRGDLVDVQEEHKMSLIIEADALINPCRISSALTREKTGYDAYTMLSKSDCSLHPV